MLIPELALAFTFVVVVAVAVVGVVALVVVILVAVASVEDGKWSHQPRRYGIPRTGRARRDAPSLNGSLQHGATAARALSLYPGAQAKA